MTPAIEAFTCLSRPSAANCNMSTGMGVTLRHPLWVMLSKDLEGDLPVEQTDHIVREGAAGLGAVGFAVGLLAPPLLAATAVGAALGTAAGKLLHRRTASKEDQAGETIPIGGAGLIVAYPHSAAGKVEPAVTRAIKKVVGQAMGHHVRALKAAISDAQQKMAADST